MRVRPRPPLLISGLAALIAAGVLTAPLPITSAPPPSGTLPPMGVFNSCEIDTALTDVCEKEDLAMRQIGITWEANFIGIAAHKTGTHSLQEWFRYDASIGLSQAIVIKHAIDDPVDVLTGNTLISGFNKSLGNDCRAVNNAQIIQCIAAVAATVPQFNYTWDIYDEPGCPIQSIGYCAGSLARGKHGNVERLAKYIHSIDPAHGIFGVNVGDCCDATNQTTIWQNLFSWLAAARPYSVGWDYYPIPQARTGQPISNIGTNTTGIARVIQANAPGTKMNVTLQAFSWYQEGGNFGCSSETLCRYPTQSQMQDERDQVLYYANQAHQPISVLWWYYWPDITCLNTYPGCSASANEAALKGAITAPFPATPPR